MASPSDQVRLERLSPFAWFVIAVVALTAIYSVLLIGFVRPYLWPAGTGFMLAGDPAIHLPLKARPPDVRDAFSAPPKITRVAPNSPASSNGVLEGDELLSMTR